MPASSSSGMRIHTLYTYPIKSIRGCTSSNLVATPLGFQYDRCLMLLRMDGEKPRNMHVSHFPEMCLFTTEISGSKVLVRYTKDHVFDQPDQKIEDEVLEVELEPDHQSLGLAKVEVDMHSSPTIGYDMGKKYNEWFGRRFGYEVKLLYLGSSRRKVLGNVGPNSANNNNTNQDINSSMSPTEPTGWFESLKTSASTVYNYATNPNSSDDKENQSPSENTYKGVNNGISFADCAPYLIISTRSWENASRRLPSNETLDISKFRPNIIVEGADEEWEEDFWAELHVGSSNEEREARLILTSNCNRCNSLNVDYDTGKVGTGEAGKILKKLMADRRVDAGVKYRPIFGRYGFLAARKDTVDGDGSATAATTDNVELKVGDTVEIVKRNAERTRLEWPGLSN